MLLIERLIVRKDITSIIVAVVLGLMLFQLVSPLSSNLVEALTDTSVGSSGSFKDLYVVPVLIFLVEFLLLEGLLRLVLLVRARYYESVRSNK